MVPLLLFFLISADASQALQRGLMALQKGDLSQARASLQEASKIDPENAFAWASLAETYARLKQTDEALASAAKAEKYGIDNPAIDHALAVFYARAGETFHAAQLEERFAASGRADLSAYERSAVLYANAGKFEEAVKAAQNALQRNHTPLAENVLGRALIGLGKLPEGEKHLVSAWEAKKDDAQYAFDLSEVLLREQQFDRAAEVLGKALESHPDDPQLVLGLGVTRYGQRRFDDAITTFLRVIRIDSQIDQPYVFIGKMLDQAGTHLPEITADYEKWSARNPKNAQALLLLAKARLAADDKDPTAESLLQRSIASDGAIWEAHYELGVLLEGKRDWAQAAAELKRSAELDEKQAMPHYHLARVYGRMGNDEGAKVERAIHEKLTGGAK